MKYTTDEQAIVACCTPQGSGAIALIRISGHDIAFLTEKMIRLSSKKKLSEINTHTIHHGQVIEVENPKHIIDEVLFFFMKSPKTFTGQDTIEISCHNNPFIINQIIAQAITCGARHAQHGEFTKRAFLNKKIDLLQAEAINELIGAQTEIALKKSMAQLKGTLSSHIEQLEHDLFTLLCLVEATFEFLDEEQRDLDLNIRIQTKLQELLTTTKTITESFAQQKQIKQGIRIALLGNVNVGKSTLFNTLVQQERAIVTNTPGTTRDAIETTCYKNGTFWLFIDTAGLRNTTHVIEQKGIERTGYEATQADIILLILDATEPYGQEHKKLIEQFKEKIIVVINKIDQTKEPPTLFNAYKPLFVSAKKNIGINILEKAIEEKIQTLFNVGHSPFLLNQRQYNIIMTLYKRLKNIEKIHKNNVQYEELAHDLKDLLEMSTQLTGKNITEQMIDSVFRNFCIGK